MKRSALSRGKPLERNSGLSRGNGGLNRRNPAEPRRGAQKRVRAISPASPKQRAKVKAEGKCRVCCLPESVIGLDPAHICDRSLGGCDDPLCIIPACRICHDGYDQGRADWLPLLSREEQAHAVSHLGIVGALRRITNDREAAR